MALRQSVESGVYDVTAPNGEKTITLSNLSEGRKFFWILCSLAWPFVDSYWVASLCLLGLISDNKIEQPVLLSKMQSVAETLYHEGQLCSCEAASSEPLANALSLFESLKIVSLNKAEAPPATPNSKKSSSSRPATMVQLVPPYNEGTVLQTFIEQIGLYRRIPALPY
eukprot:TRINITY_DN5734_c0_g1_i12.p1 TRINITY_DN5734_c0_g1~~TRINITY_DN5734_c0_g1_i12.p1  ORF type:complete len:168 (-),score=43.85 TRINITY_DN5734_c0_g1_i12:72-575(-)